MVESLSYVNSIRENIKISQQTNSNHHFAKSFKGVVFISIMQIAFYRYWKVCETKYMAAKYFIIKNNELTTTCKNKIDFEKMCEMNTTKCYFIMHVHGILYFVGF